MHPQNDHPPVDVYSTMAEATIALGALMRHLPAASVEVDAEFGIRVTACNMVGLFRWAEALNADSPDNRGTDLGFHTLTFTAEVKGMPVTVLHHMDPIGGVA